MSYQKKKDPISIAYEKAKANAEISWSLVDTEIQMPEALLYYKGEPVIFQNSTILIQGKTGTHKSRFATTLNSLFLSPHSDIEKYGFSRKSKSSNPVLYIDTERDKKIQLPLMLQQLVKDTGLTKDELKTRLTLLPLGEISRLERLHVMGKEVRNLAELNKSGQSLIVTLDIISDFASDFNSVEATYMINDALNLANNLFNVTIIPVIHENPGEGEKARGHLGTELTNKASTVFQIAEVKGMKNCFRIKILKSRMTEKYDEVLLKFDPIANNLMLVTDEELLSKAVDPDLYRLGVSLAKKGYKPIERKDLICHLVEDLRWKERKIEEKLKIMVDEQREFETALGTSILIKERGKTTIYKVELLPPEAAPIPDENLPVVPENEHNEAILDGNLIQI